MGTQLARMDGPTPGPEITGGIERLEGWANALVIRSPRHYENAVETLKQVKAAKSRVVEFFGGMKSKAHAAWKAICDQEGSYTKRLDAVEATAKRAVIAYQQEQERTRIEEQRRLQAEADEKARRERERIEREAARQRQIEADARSRAEAARKAAEEEADAAERARLLREAQAAERRAEAAAVRVETKLEQAAMVEAPVVEVASSTPRLAGIAARTTWKARVVNLAMVPREWMIVNQDALDKFAGATKGAVPVPGVEFYSEQGLAVGRGR